MHGMDFGPTRTPTGPSAQGEFCVQIPSRVHLYIYISTEGRELSSPTLSCGASRTFRHTCFCTRDGRSSALSPPCYPRSNTRSMSREGSNDRLAIVKHEIPPYIIPDCRRGEPTGCAPEPARVAAYLYDNALRDADTSSSRIVIREACQLTITNSPWLSPFLVTRNVRLAGGQQLAGLRGLNRILNVKPAHLLASRRLTGQRRLRPCKLCRIGLLAYLSSKGSQKGAVRMAYRRHTYIPYSGVNAPETVNSFTGIDFQFNVSMIRPTHRQRRSTTTDVRPLHFLL